MSIFKRDFNKPGPGVPKNAPKKRGVARFFEIMGKNMGNIFKLNLLFALCALPVEVLAWFALRTVGTPMFLVFLAGIIVAAIPLGPAQTAMSYIVVKMLRDEPGFLWHDFKKEFKSNFRKMLLPGMIYALIIVTQVFAYLSYLLSGADGAIWVIAILMFSTLVFIMAVPYFFVQAAYLDLGNVALLKNSLLLALGNTPRSFVGALLGSGLLVAQGLFMPFTLPLLVCFGYAIPHLLNLMWIWPPVDKIFKIDTTLKERDTEKYDVDGMETGE